MATLPELLNALVSLSGSDLHLTTNSPPLIRVHGKLQTLDLPVLGPAETKSLAYSVLTDAQKKRFEESLELDFSFGIRGLARFRCNVFNQRGAVAAVYRLIPETIRSFSDLGLPPVIAKLSERPRGLVLVTGPTGSGKSTTLAAMIDKINTERAEHILTIEDPIEYIHQHKGCLVNQREIHSDTNSFTMALRAALRGNRSLDVRDAAHELGAADHQPNHRCVPGASAGPDSHAALARAGRHRLSDAAAQGQHARPYRRARNPGADAGHPQSDSRR